MASCLSKAITKETTRLKHLLAEYNSAVIPSEQLTWEEVCHPSAQVWLRLEQPLNLPVPKPVRIAAINALMTQRRTEEEVVMLKQEMKAVMAFHMKDVAALTSAIGTLDESETMTAYDRGCISLLKVRLSKVKGELHSCCFSYEQHVDVPDLTSLNLDLHVPPLDNMDFIQEQQELSMEDDLEEEPLPSPLYYPDLSAGCSEHGLYLSDSDESVDSTEQADEWEKEAGLREQETDDRGTWEQEEGVWVEKREEQADEWEEEAGLREQEANSVQMENNEWEEDEEEAMEEERYITVLHNRLRREEFEKVKGIE